MDAFYDYQFSLKDKVLLLRLCRLAQFEFVVSSDGHRQLVKPCGEVVELPAQPFLRLYAEVAQVLASSICFSLKEHPFLTMRRLRLETAAEIFRRHCARSRANRPFCEDDGS